MDTSEATVIAMILIIERLAVPDPSIRRVLYVLAVLDKRRATRDGIRPLFNTIHQRSSVRLNVALYWRTH
jgi:hypothetical protein